MTTSPTKVEHAQTEALRLADEWQRKTQREADRQNSAYDHYGMGNTPETVDPLGAKMAAELRRLHAQVAALTAQPAAPQGVAYAELPEFKMGRGYIERSIGGVAYREGWVDALEALRASNGQAPAGAALYPGCSHWGMRDTPATAQAAPAAGAVAGPEIEFDGYKGRHNVRWYINELNRVRIVNQWLADVYCNKLRDFFTAEYRQHSRNERDAEWMAGNAIADLARGVTKSLDSYWLPGADIPDLAQFERTHDEVTKRLLSGLAAAPTPAAQADSVLEDAARWNEVLMHVGAANHLGGQHFTLNTLRIRDQMFLLRGSVAQHFTACIDDSRAARKQGGV